VTLDGPAAGELQDKVVLASGGTQALGAAVARAAVPAGARVVITGRRADGDQQVVGGYD